MLAVQRAVAATARPFPSSDPWYRSGGGRRAAVLAVSAVGRREGAGRIRVARAGASKPMQIRLTDERREQLVFLTQRFFAEEFDREISDFQASRLIDFFVRTLGAPVYNQAIHDARAAVQTKLDDLEGEFYEPEEP
jgi:uncharacterized protein (DUF2164 family)